MFVSGESKCRWGRNCARAEINDATPARAHLRPRRHLLHPRQRYGGAGRRTRRRGSGVRTRTLRPPSEPRRQASAGSRRETLCSPRSASSISSLAGPGPAAHAPAPPLEVRRPQHLGLVSVQVQQVGPSPVHARDGDPVPPPRVQALELRIIPDLSAELGEAVEEPVAYWLRGLRWLQPRHRR